MANDVKVVIEVAKASTRVGFGFPMIFASKQSAAVAYTEVGSLAEVVTAGFTAESEVYKAASLLFMQNDAPSKIAVCASTDAAVTALPAVVEEGWRQLVVICGEEDSPVDAISDYIEACGLSKMYFASVHPTNDATVIAAVEGNTRTVLVGYKTTEVAHPEAAVVGATAGLDVGSFTYKNVVIKGVTAQSFTDAEVEAMHEDGVITILKKAGSIVTSEGIVVSGEYIDIVDAKDYIIQQIEHQCQSLMNRVPKLPYDNRGIASLEGVVLSVLKDAANNGMIAVDDEGEYDYTVNFLPRSECSGADISARHYAEGSFAFALAGAIHSARITGTILA